MCMGRELSQLSLSRYKVTGKQKGYIRIWKVVIRGKHYYPEYFRTNISFKAGLNYQYNGHPIHAFRDKKSARKWITCSNIILECLIKPVWVVKIGKTLGDDKKTLTVSTIVMPKFPKTIVGVREFKKITAVAER